MDSSPSSSTSSSSSHGRRCSRRTHRRHRHCRVSSSMRRSASSSSSSSSSVAAVVVILSIVMIIAAVTFDSSAATAVDSASASAFTAFTDVAAAATIAATEVEDPTLPEAAAASSEEEEEEEEEEGSCTNNNDSSSNNNNNTEGTEDTGSCDRPDSDDDSDSPAEDTDDISSKDIPPEVVMYKDRWVGCEDYERVWDEYEQVEEYQTLQQSVDIYYSEQSDDGCLFLHGYLHMCSSNRPHYHEPFVHYPGRFLSNVERVLFIGGGDSMVLHEVMKYPSVELVVGLELDQSVVRSSFQFFGTQPHWDDDRVEWYFGDGAKSLNLLPRNYYGTFDLVVVDILSPIAQSLQVNDELTVMEALMLLLKPDGIIVKNEDEGYIPGANTANFTKHSVEIMFHDVPIYCLQTFVVGTNSNNKNFKDAVPKDHGVETKYLKNVDEFQSQFDSYYTSNDKNLLDVMCERPPPSSSSSSTTTNLPADNEKESNNGEEEGEDLELQKERREKQAEEKEDAESTPSEEKKSETNTTDADNEDEDSEREDWDYMKLVKWQAPIGVNMILEAESTSGGDSKFRTTSDIVSTFRPLLTSDALGLVIVDTNELEFTRDGFTANVVTFVVDQGYIVVRCVPALSYCGFDIQLWADFHKHPQIKSALLSGVGGATNVSQFRVVTSGMIDAKNEQSELIGPPSVRDYCDSRSTRETTSSEQGGTSVTVELAQTPLNEREFRNTTLHSYDSTSKSAREQWSSQRSIGVQTISQFEETKGKNVRLPSVITILKKAIELNNANQQDDDDDYDESIETQEINDFSGNGSIVIASWSKGQAIVLWDGDGRVDVNWFVFGVDIDIPDSLMATFDNAISMLLAFTAIVRDEIPRGTGRIIDFHSEFENRDDVDPLWF